MGKRRVQTLKSSDANGGAAMSRGEWEWPVRDDKPDLTLAAGAPVASRLPPDLASNYSPRGTLVGRWFRGLDEAGSIAANFAVSAGILIPAALIMGGWPVPSGGEGNFAALLLLVGTLAAGAAGRVVYQMALTVTENDNGFVTMFSCSFPVCRHSFPLFWSSWISDLHFAADSMFFVGLALVAAPLFVFSMKSRKIG